MKDKKNRHGKSLLTALVLAAASLSLGTVGTVAYFQSTSTVKASVTTGKVDIKATIVDGSFTKPDWVSTSTDGTSVTLGNMAPGDRVSFPVQIENESTIATKFHVTHTITTESTDTSSLKDDLEISTTADSWLDLDANTNPDNVTVTITLPDTGTVQTYYNTKVTIAFNVEAIQKTAKVPADNQG